MSGAVRVCYVGERLIAKDKAWNKEQNMWECSRIKRNSTNETTQLYFLYCHNLTIDMDSTDPDCVYFRSNPVGLRRGIPGLPSGVFYSKLLIVIIISVIFDTQLSLYVLLVGLMQHISRNFSYLAILTFLFHRGDTLYRWGEIRHGGVELSSVSNFTHSDGCETPKKTEILSNFWNKNALQGRICCTFCLTKFLPFMGSFMFR